MDKVFISALLLLSFKFYVYVCFHSMFVCAPHACLVLKEPRRGRQISYISGSELLSRCWGLNPESLSEQPVLLFAEPLSSPSQNILYSPQVQLLQKTLTPPDKKVFPVQLWLNKLLFFVVIYFYLKEFVSLSQKLEATPPQQSS